MKRVLLCLLALLVLCVPASAHPGKTDSKGGHYNRSTGEYHYHHGHPAHQHVDGVCPYDFATKEPEEASTYRSSGSSTSVIATLPTRQPQKETVKEDRPSVLMIVVYVLMAPIGLLAVFIGGMYIISLILAPIDKLVRRTRKHNEKASSNMPAWVRELNKEGPTASHGPDTIVEISDWSKYYHTQNTTCILLPHRERISLHAAEMSGRRACPKCMPLNVWSIRPDPYCHRPQ